MFNFAFGTNFLPSYVSKEDLVENHLMTLVEYLDEDKQGTSNYIVGGFLPEGVINLLSARYFIWQKDSLKSIFSSSVKYGLCDIGNFGELFAQFILLHTIFFSIDKSFQRIRKLAFKPVLLKEFLLNLAGAENKNVINDFFGINELLKGSKISFGYFEHFPKYPINDPFDLMAKCIFRGSATTLNSLYPGIDLMIPLVLNDGKISFIAIQVKFVRKEEYVNQVLQKALKKMNFTKMFPEYHQDNRPFGLIVLIFGEYSFKVFTPKGKEAKNHNPLLNPLPLIFKGIPTHLTGVEELFKIAPTDLSYRGIGPEYLSKCDRLRNLIREANSASESEEEVRQSRAKRVYERPVSSSHLSRKRSKQSPRHSDGKGGPDGAGPSSVGTTSTLSGSKRKVAPRK